MSDFVDNFPSHESILSDEFLEQFKDKQPNWGYNGLGYIVYKRTYARPIDPKDPTSRTEEWWETVARCVRGAQKIGACYTKDEAERLFNYVFHLKGNFAGRMLWQLGTSTVDRFGGNSLLNCWYVSITKPEDFCFIFENLMLGGGVGYSVKREHVFKLPRIRKNVKITHQKTNDADFIVPDSREGWVNLLRKVLHSYFVTGESFTYSTLLIRSKDEPINGFGGRASGPQILIDGIEKIGQLLNTRNRKQLRSIDVLDICNIIGSIVVAGNVRRSAEIAIGDPDDILYLRAKRWDLGNIPNHRAMSNNSIYVDTYDKILPEVWDGYNGNGEPYGLINLRNAQRYGRLGDKRRDNCEGFNPCAEIGLADYECCNLSELYLNNIVSRDELVDLAKLIYKTQKAVCMLPFLHKPTQKIVRKNMRIGLGVTGVCQALDKLEWLDDAYKALREFDVTWSKLRGWNVSIKLTTVKPSGTLSLLAGSTPGVHPGYSPFYIRRVRMSSSDALVPTCRDLGYHVEYVLKFDGSEDRDTVVVSFPCEAGDSALVARDMTAIRQLELVKKLQTVWADNAVSVTVYYKKEELPEIKEWLKANLEESIKSVSFLLHSAHGFKQAPYEEIDYDTYMVMSSQVKPLTQFKGTVSDMLDMAECAGGACPIR
jgi:ribonucleoside-triphosphate reductase